MKFQLLIVVPGYLLDISSRYPYLLDIPTSIDIPDKNLKFNIENKKLFKFLFLENDFFTVGGLCKALILNFSDLAIPY